MVELNLFVFYPSSIHFLEIKGQYEAKNWTCPDEIKQDDYYHDYYYVDNGDEKKCGQDDKGWVEISVKKENVSTWTFHWAKTSVKMDRLKVSHWHGQAGWLVGCCLHLLNLNKHLSNFTVACTRLSTLVFRSVLSIVNATTVMSYLFCGEIQPKIRLPFTIEIMASRHGLLVSGRLHHDENNRNDCLLA